jgi:hypothetical protein
MISLSINRKGHTLISLSFFFELFCQASSTNRIPAIHCNPQNGFVPHHFEGFPLLSGVKEIFGPLDKLIFIASFFELNL